MRPRDLLAAVALAVLLGPAPAAAQAGSDADTREVQAYRLTMPKLRQLNQVLLDFERQREADPAYRDLQRKKAELAKLEEKDEVTEAEEARMAKLGEEIALAEESMEEEEDSEEPQSLSRMAAKMTADPRIAKALKAGGLEAREAAVLQLALFQAAFTAEGLESGTIKEIPKEVNAENVRFLRANKAEIATFTALGGRKE